MATNNIPDLTGYGLSELSSLTGSYAVNLPNSNLGASKTVALIPGNPNQVTIHTSQGSFYVSPTNPFKNLVYTQSPPWTSISEFNTSFFPTVQQARLVGNGGTGSGNLGYSVALSSDGNTLAAGNPFDGSSQYGRVFIFVRSNNVWSQQILLASSTSGADFGYSVALSSDGNTLAIGAPGNNTIYIYNRTGTSWNSSSPVILTNSSSVDLGASIALSSNGQVLVAGDPGYSSSAGGVFNSNLVNGSWSTLTPVFTGSNYTGASIAISSDGTTFATGTGTVTPGQNTGKVYIYTSTSIGSWTLQTTISNPSSLYGFGYSVALSASGNILATGTPYNSSGIGIGSVQIFYRTNTTWTTTPVTLVATGYSGSAPAQGYSVALSADGNTLAIGAPYNNTSNGCVFIFTQDIYGAWSQQGTYLFGTGGGSNLFEGSSVALSSDGSTLAIGSRGSGASNSMTWIFV